MLGQRLRFGFDDGMPPYGAYWKSKSGTWMCCTPNGLLGNLAKHDVVEHDDGTITVSPSILVWTESERWHGYLEKGVFRSC